MTIRNFGNFAGKKIEKSANFREFSTEKQMTVRNSRNFSRHFREKTIEKSADFREFSEEKRYIPRRFRDETIDKWQILKKQK